MPDHPPEAFALDTPLGPLDIPDPAWPSRVNIRREGDRKLIGWLVGGAVTLLSMGVAWGTATAAMRQQFDQKLDRSAQVPVDEQQDRRLTALETQFAVVIDGLRRLNAGVDSANTRLRQMACEGKPPSCR